MFIVLYFKLEVGAFMLSKKGSTLIESLFAFEIFITVLVVGLSLFTSLFHQEVKIDSFYQQLHKKEGECLYQDSFVENVEMALRS